MSKQFRINLIASLICFLVPLIGYLLTMSSSIDFLDSGEFALVTKLGSIAHPPGNPAYVLSAWIWVNFLELFTSDNIFLITLFSAISVSLSIVFIYNTAFHFLKHIPNNKFSELQIAIIATISALSMAFGMTFWDVATTIEVYGYHLLAGAIMINGLSKYQLYKNYKYLAIGALGYSLALANHHVTPVFFTPFILFFFAEELFNKISKKKRKIGFVDFLKKTFTGRPFWFLTILTTVLTTGFYSWMVYRASLDFPFEFGNPDTWDRFWYHVSGQTYMSKFKVSDKSGGEYFMLKLPYYSYLIFRQYICFFPFIILGIVFLIKNKLFKFLTFSALYFGVNMFFQLYRPHEASGDIEGYIVMPFYVFGLIIPYGVYYLARMNKFYWLASFLLIPQIALNLPRVDKSKYDVSESLMQELDRASPQNSVVIISDWTLVIHYYYYRIVNNFRPDLTVLNYDFKFTNYMIVPTLYPEFYKSIQKEYDDFVDELGKEHPPLIYNTGCRLTTTKLLNKFNKVLLKVESLCKENNRTLLFDPKAFYSYGNLVKFRRNVYPSGCLFSLSPTEQGREFINLDMDWIESSILPYDPCATEKLVDFEAALDMHMRHYQKLGDKEGYKQAQESKQKMKRMQKILKRNFPNLFLNEFTIQQNKKKQQKQQSKKGDVYFNPSANPKKN